MRDYRSWQFDDEDPWKYLINYLDDDSENHQELNTNSEIGSPEDSGEIDVSTLPNDLIVTPVPQELFTDPELKDKFEQLFRQYDPQIVVLYLKFFQRVRITFTSSTKALQARLHLHEYPFQGTIIKTYFACPIIFRGANPDNYLRPPEPDKLFLISPPASPPVGWEQKLEDPPVVDLNLLAAIVQLRPNEVHELLPSELGSKAPAIVIHTCDDPEGGNDLQRDKLTRPTLIQTKRPPRID